MTKKLGLVTKETVQDEARIAGGHETPTIKGLIRQMKKAIIQKGHRKGSLASLNQTHQVLRPRQYLPWFHPSQIRWENPNLTMVNKLVIEMFMKKPFDFWKIG
jgi:hypothetical protein